MGIFNMHPMVYIKTDDLCSNQVKEGKMLKKNAQQKYQEAAPEEPKVVGDTHPPPTITGK